MIKFLSTTIGVLIAVVGFLYYLMQNTNFIPMDNGGTYLSINILMFFFLLFIAIACICILGIFGTKRISTKGEDLGLSIRFSVKYGMLLSIGLLFVYILHFFHILNFIWGLAILLVVILSLFVI